MLIRLENLLRKFGLNIKGILHIGAHECEELKSYKKCGVNPNTVYWVEAMPNKVELMKKKHGRINIYQAVIDNENDREIMFNVANNGQSSSMLEFGTHTTHHPNVKMVDKLKLTTTRLDTLIEKNNIPISNLNFINLDIQGKELDALKSLDKHIQYFDYVYSEVNTEKVYEGGCLLSEMDSFLKEHGFTRVEIRMTDFGWGDAFYIKK